MTTSALHRHAQGPIVDLSHELGVTPRGHRDQARQCRFCRWWQSPDAQHGRCRRAAPHYSKRQADWPETVASDWCGDWS